MIWSWLWTSKGTELRYRRTQRVVVEGCLCLCRSWHSSSKWGKRNTVNSETLSRCPSDLIALSLFLWSAQRRRHDSVAFDRIVPVLRRLTHRYDTVPSILSHLETIGCASLTNPESQLGLLRIYSRAGMLMVYKQNINIRQKLIQSGTQFWIHPVLKICQM